MAKIPALCDNCGNLFFDDGSIGIAEGTQVKIKVTNSIVICPNCHHPANIIDGEYNFVGNILQTIRTSKANLDQLIKAKSLFENAQRENLTQEALSETIKKEVPELSKLADILPKKRAELYSVLAIIVAVLFGLINSYKGSGGNSNNINVTNNYTQTAPVRVSAGLQRPGRKVNVNSPCYCGSNRKFKKCHGARAK